MFAIDVELLTGRYVATAFNDRDAPEWPPHPARVYSALVATWAIAGQPDDERDALEWLAAQPPPTVYATPAFARSSVSVFVPVDDVHVVDPPAGARDRLAAAECAKATARDDKERAKAIRAIDRARKQLAADTAKKIAVPNRLPAKRIAQARAVLPQSRRRQPRTFPSVTPIEPRFVLVWNANPPDRVRSALQSLCERVVRIGHSSSFVRASVSDHDSVPFGADPFVPDDGGSEVLRVPRPGQLQALVAAFEVHQEVEPRHLPCRFARYRHGARPVSADRPRSNLSSDWLVLARAGGDRLPITATPGLAHAFRAALLAHAEQPIPSFLSGHDADGAPTELPHLAFVPLPFVASKYADGQILGIALVPPRDAAPSALQSVARAIEAWEQEQRKAHPDLVDEDAPPLPLYIGKRSAPAWQRAAIQFRRVPFGLPAKITLRPYTWSRPSRRWASATPIALDRNPGDLHDKNPEKRARAFANAEDIVRTACERNGLPPPLEVDVLRSAVLPGSEKPSHFPRFPHNPQRTQRVLVHARILFAEAVEGPILLGAGRYLGLGLMRPLDASTEVVR